MSLKDLHYKSHTAKYINYTNRISIPPLRQEADHKYCSRLGLLECLD